jgi:hypothetical protein
MYGGIVPVVSGTGVPSMIPRTVCTSVRTPYSLLHDHVPRMIRYNNTVQGTGFPITAVTRPPLPTCSSLELTAVGKDMAS